MTTILITGANRGLGFGLLQKFLAHSDPPALILATYRSLEKSKKLIELSKNDARLIVLKLDIADIDSFSEFADEVANKVGPSGLNTLINMAGIAKKKDTFDAVTAEDYLETYKTNVVGPIFLIKALLPLLKRAAASNADQQGIRRAAILNISSFLGSVGDNLAGSHYSYRESKAALNTFSRSLSYELKDHSVIVLPIHPGWVQTELGGPLAHLTVDESVTGMCNLIYSLNNSHNGQFLQWDGQTVRW